VLDQLKPSVENSPSDDVWKRFVRTSGSIRIIIANNEDPGKRANAAIQEFRKFATLDAYSTLVFGARASDDNARLNATLVLGNVIDNQSICVPIDHLYDPVLGPEATGTNIRGRANLLGVVSVVAPWAYRENYGQITDLLHYERRKLEPLSGNLDVKQTFQILDNIETRLAFQNNAGSNREQSVPLDLGACKFYKPRWPNHGATNPLQ
jgi:hypothetical protein